TYQPGEAGEVFLEIDTLSQSAGPNAWRAVVRYRTGDADPEAVLLIRAQLVREITVEPAALDLNVTANGQLRAEIVVTDLRPRPFSVTRAATSSLKLKAEV